MKYLLIIILFVSSTSKIKVKRIIDGDTLLTLTNERVRLAEIDAPEIHQTFGLQAKQFLSSLLANKTVTIKREGKGRYGRIIGKLFVNGVYINKIMVDSGEAWAYKKYSSLYNDEIEARNKRIGLWRYPNPEPPYLFRKHDSTKHLKYARRYNNRAL